jgi:hypothetical protein
VFVHLQVVGSRGTVEVNPRSLMLTEGSIIGVMLAGATKVSYPFNNYYFSLHNM